MKSIDNIRKSLHGRFGAQLGLVLSAERLLHELRDVERVRRCCVVARRHVCNRRRINWIDHSGGVIATTMTADRTDLSVDAVADVCLLVTEKVVLAVESGIEKFE